MNKFIASLTIIAASTAFLAPAFAAPAKEVNGSLTTGVKIADLNLSSIAGQKALANRIRGAAANVCSPFRGGGKMSLVTTYSDCVKLAVENATAASQSKIASAIAQQSKVSIDVPVSVVTPTL